MKIAFYVLVGLGFLFSLGGAFDNFNSLVRPDEYMKDLPDMLAFVKAMPLWAVIAWTIAVWGQVIACILLLMRKALSRWVMSASVLGMFISFGYQFTASTAPEQNGGQLAFVALIFVVAIALLITTFRGTQSGWLK